MSREQYTPPDLTTGTGTGGAAASQGTSNFAVTGNNAFEDTTRAINYLCGECDAKVILSRGDAIRCKECGYRVLYKERTNRCVRRLEAQAERCSGARGAGSSVLTVCVQDGAV